MFDHLLTLILQAVILIDLLGAIAYFILGGIRHKKQAAKAIPVAAPLVVPIRPPFWSRLFSRRTQPAPATQDDFEQLRQILQSFQEGLN